MPEAELDRFFLRMSLGHPAADDELEIVRDQRHRHPLEAVETVARIADIQRVQRVVAEVYIDELI